MSKKHENKHREAISGVLKYINNSTPNGTGFVLKGGTALMTCYGLDRFSEDIDFDATDSNLFYYIGEYCKENDLSYRIAKDTETVRG
jgi:predicted nucleotidyltransferase component of viral defense system